jgi:hypothetical protein
MASSVGAMSVTWDSTPRCSHSRRPRAVLSGEDSRSGRSNANTRSAPTARTASAAQTELSMPPETATTSPRLRSVAGQFAQGAAMRSASSLEVERQRGGEGGVAAGVTWAVSGQDVGLRLDEAAQDLARGTAGQRRSTKTDALGDLVGGQVLSAARCTACASTRGHARIELDVDLDDLAEQLVGCADGDGLLDTRHLRCDDLFDLERADAVRAALDHVSAAAVEEEEPLGVEAPDVAGVQPAVAQHPRLQGRRASSRP